MSYQYTGLEKHLFDFQPEPLTYFTWEDEERMNKILNEILEVLRERYLYEIMDESIKKHIKYTIHEWLHAEKDLPKVWNNGKLHILENFDLKSDGTNITLIPLFKEK